MSIISNFKYKKTQLEYKVKMVDYYWSDASTTIFRRCVTNGLFWILIIARSIDEIMMSPPILSTPPPPPSLNNTKSQCPNAALQFPINLYQVTYHMLLKRTTSLDHCPKAVHHVKTWQTLHQTMASGMLLDTRLFINTGGCIIEK